MSRRERERVFFFILCFSTRSFGHCHLISLFLSRSAAIRLRMKKHPHTLTFSSDCKCAMLSNMHLLVGCFDNHHACHSERKIIIHKKWRTKTPDDFRRKCSLIFLVHKFSFRCFDCDWERVGARKTAHQSGVRFSLVGESQQSKIEKGNANATHTN